jgi:hypothetical protein
MKILRAIYDIKGLSIFILFLPYFFFNLDEILKSNFFSIKNIFLFFIILIIINYWFKYILSFFTKKNKNFISFSIFYLLTFFIYGVYLIYFFQNISMNYLDFIVRGRNISAIFLVIFVIIIFFIKDDLSIFFYYFLVL